MGILKKHQIKGVEGFKNFVKNLETMSSVKRQQILELSFLEDPLYTQWVEKNLYDITILFEIGGDYFPDLYDGFGRKMEIFFQAFHMTELEPTFLTEFLDEGMHPHYLHELDDMHGTEIPKVVTSTARVKILEKIRELQENNSAIFGEIKWNVPGEAVLKGLTDIPKSGAFKSYYSPGFLALEGNYEEKLREGKWKHYFPENKLMAEGYYHQDEKVDDWVFYNPLGTVVAKGEYKEDLRDGEWELVDENHVPRKVIYKRGRITQ